MAFIPRGPVAPGRYLDWKIRLFFVAAVLLLVGIARDIGPLVLLAIVVLAVAFLLRFLEPRHPPHEDDGDEDEPEESVSD